MDARVKAWIDTALPIVMAIAASLAVFLNLTLVGPMAWHFQQPAAVQGGIEAILLLTMLVGRVGILNFFFSLLPPRREESHLRLPRERIIVE